MIESSLEEERTQVRFRPQQPVCVSAPREDRGDRGRPQIDTLEPAVRAPAAREERMDRGRSQLNTLESLVARQNVVLDSLLTKVSSFSNVEHALMAIERRLSGQVGSGTGVATPRVGIFVDVPNIIYAAGNLNRRGH